MSGSVRDPDLPSGGGFRFRLLCESVVFVVVGPIGIEGARAVCSGFVIEHEFPPGDGSARILTEARDCEFKSWLSGTGTNTPVPVKSMATSARTRVRHSAMASRRRSSTAFGREFHAGATPFALSLQTSMTQSPSMRKRRMTRISSALSVFA